MTNEQQKKLAKELDNLYLPGCSNDRPRHGCQLELPDKKKEDSDILDPSKTEIVNPFTKIYESDPTQKDD